MMYGPGTAGDNVDLRATATAGGSGAIPPKELLTIEEPRDRTLFINPKKVQIWKSVGVATLDSALGPHDTHTPHGLCQPAPSATGGQEEQGGVPLGSAAAGGSGATKDYSASLQLVGGLASDVGDMALSFADLDDSVPVANKAAGYDSSGTSLPLQICSGVDMNTAGVIGADTAAGTVPSARYTRLSLTNFSSHHQASSNSVFSSRLEAPSAGNECSNFLGNQHSPHDGHLGGMGLGSSFDMPAGIGAFGAPATQPGSVSGVLDGAPAWNPFGSSILEAVSVTSELMQKRPHSGLPLGAGLSTPFTYSAPLLSLPVTEAGNNTGALGPDLGYEGDGPSLPLSGPGSSQAMLPSSTSWSSKQLDAPAAGDGGSKVLNSPLKSIYPLSGMGVEPPLDATTAIRAYGEPGTRGGRGKTGRGAAAWKPFAEPILELPEDPFDVQESSTSSGGPTGQIASAAAASTAGVGGARAGAEGPSKDHAESSLRSLGTAGSKETGGFSPQNLALYGSLRTSENTGSLDVGDDEADDYDDTRSDSADGDEKDNFNGSMLLPGYQPKALPRSKAGTMPLLSTTHNTKALGGHAFESGDPDGGMRTSMDPPMDMPAGVAAVEVPKPLAGRGQTGLGGPRDFTLFGGPLIQLPIDPITEKRGVSTSIKPHVDITVSALGTATSVLGDAEAASAAGTEAESKAVLPDALSLSRQNWYDSGPSTGSVEQAATAGVFEGTNKTLSWYSQASLPATTCSQQSFSRADEKDDYEDTNDFMEKIAHKAIVPTDIWH